MNNYKRRYRELDDATKQKISQKLKNRSKSMTHGETGACWDSMGVIKQCQDLHFRAGRQD